MAVNGLASFIACQPKGGPTNSTNWRGPLIALCAAMAEEQAELSVLRLQKALTLFFGAPRGDEQELWCA